MTPSFRSLLLAVAALGAMTGAQAQQASKLTSSEIALEVPAAAMVLPVSATSAAVFPPCGGCAPKSFPVTATTAYYLKRDPVSVADLKAAIIGRPDLILTAVYSRRTGALISVTADITAPRANSRSAR